MDFLEDIIKRSSGRKIVFWGDGDYYEDMKRKLEARNSEVAFIVDSNLRKVNEKIIKKTIELDGKSSEYYVVILIAYHIEIYSILEEYGYKELEDFFYLNHQPMELNKGNNYSDRYGNKLIGYWNSGKIVFCGYNSTIKIGKNFRFTGVLVILSNCNIEIGDNVKVIDARNWKFFDNSNVIIGNDCKFRERSILQIHNNSSLEIGNKSTFEGKSTFIILNECTIGEDCQISNYVTFRDTDSHSIFDVITGENINSAKEIKKKRKISIGNHVWICERSTILCAELADGIIVGANSLVKGRYGNNCTIAGVPARVIKKNIAWGRKYGIEILSKYEKKFAKCTRNTDGTKTDLCRGGELILIRSSI